MRILFAGTPSTAATVLEGLISSGHEIVAVLTREDAPVGRKKTLTPSPVADVAASHGLRTIKASKLTPDVLDEIKASKVELAVVVAYGVILRQDALDAIPNGWFNLHFSVLPRWRGAAPVQHAISAGDTQTGVTLFKIDSGLDTGEVVGLTETVIEPEETAGELLQRLSSIGLTLLNQELPKLYAGTYKLNQQSGQESFAPKIQRAEAKVNFSKSSKELENLIRAMNPEPMAWCLFAGEPMRIIRARCINHGVELSQGEVALVDQKVLVGTGSEQPLEILEVQPASKSAMSARAWINGHSGKVVLY